MNLQDTLLLIYTAATVFQVVVVAISVIYLYRQASDTRKSVQNIEESGRLNTYLLHRRDVQEINRLLLTNDTLGEAVGYSRIEYLGFLFLGHAETMFRLNRDGYMSTNVWNTMQTLIEKISKMKFVTGLWPKVKTEFTADFSAHFDELLRCGNASSGEKKRPDNKS